MTRLAHTRRVQKNRREIRHESSVRPDRVALRTRLIHGSREPEAIPLTASANLIYAESDVSIWVCEPANRPTSRAN